MRRKTHTDKKDRLDVAKSKIRKALVLLGTATIMGATSCGAGMSERNPMDAARESPSHAEAMRESEIVLTPSEDGTRLRAEVIVYEPGESASEDVNIRDVMEEIVSTCQDRADVQVCINHEAIERTGSIRGTILADAQVEFQYWSSENNKWEGLWGVSRGNECDISNIVPSTIRVIFTPENGSDIGPSTAVYRVPQSLDSD